VDPVGTLQVDFALQVDQLSLVMLLVVTGVGSLIHLFSIGYMKEIRDTRATSRISTSSSSSCWCWSWGQAPVMFVGWEGVGLCSYLLIGFWFSEAANANAGRKAFIMNRIGDFGFNGRDVPDLLSTGSLDFRHRVTPARPRWRRAAAPSRRSRSSCSGLYGKSAQIPLYTWLPDAMAGRRRLRAHPRRDMGRPALSRCALQLLFAMARSRARVAGVGA